MCCSRWDAGPIECGAPITPAEHEFPGRKLSSFSCVLIREIRVCFLFVFIRVHSWLIPQPEMQTRLLGNTGLRLPILGFGASSLGQEFGRVTPGEALQSVRVALECGLSFIDTSPFYGRGMSE